MALDQPTPTPAPKPAPDWEEERTLADQVGLFEQAQSMGLPTPEDDENIVTREQLRAMLSQAGIDMDNPDVTLLIEYAGEMDAAMATTWVTILSANPDYQKVGITTQYSEALAYSGFTGSEFALPATPATRLLAEQGIEPAAVGPKGPLTQPESGWQLYANGVLVDKTNPDPWGSVIFKPGSEAPGSTWWYDKIQLEWTPEEVATWRERLGDLGYLPKEDVDTKGFDEKFRQALTEFHVYRYYNGGKAVPLDAAASGPLRPTITPRDFATATRNNVRQQFMGVFGNEPTEAELNSWTRFTITQAVQLQRQYMRKGIDESSALSAARTIAGEETVNALWEDPYGVHQRENELENTALRDSLQRAIEATAGLT